MSKARLVITALFTEGLTPSQVAERYGVHRAWVYKLKARYDATTLEEVYLQTVSTALPIAMAAETGGEVRS